MCRARRLPRRASAQNGGVTASTEPSTGLVLLRKLTWWGLVGCLVGMVVILASEVRTDPAPAAAGMVLAVALTVCAVSGRLFAVPVLGTPPPPAVVTAVAATGAGAILLYAQRVHSGGFPWALPLAAVLAAVHAGAGWPGRVVWPAGTALAFGASLAGSWSIEPAAAADALTDAGITVLCAAALYAQVWMSTVAERLEQARRAERTTAITDERQRFAAELHDIQGHNLQVIALKSELAERLADIDPARAVAQMREVQVLARRALGDTRELVRGYRAVSLETEIANAARVLEAAGIESTISRPDGLPLLPPTVGNLLGLVARECTTNVLRHSTARRCDIVLIAEAGTLVLRFVNDAPLEPTGPAGGLAGLRDRLTAAGGCLRSTRTADSFTVQASLPMPAAR
ncbi:hypothetical protein BG844_35100 [Couchioplanes caeruleus subsp. caeruleus]|uniref:Signal transduction histidine kinase subgroup 3 dimerisation and phosphoacceptor domain-containing protein n=2 Tax=Couchioplanes caeruleus TaxID=56438 RepID=A0A1K0FAW1_9ACTN|nr:hypothetical protein BG844_35100 [Couchioplanes caeruleus subsp. caeruleus]